MRAATVCGAYFTPEYHKNDPVCRDRQRPQDTPKQDCGWQKSSEQELEDDLIAKEFVDRLLSEGCEVPCDETSDTFKNQACLPTYYDRNLYKQGQQFFYKHIFGLFLSKLLGLIALLSLPLTLKILMLTNMSGTPLTAYRRYMATIFHMCIWYDEDFENEKSLRLWSSINKVRGMHNAASNKANTNYQYRINQMDMALTQFGFMGISLVRSEMMGVHNVSDLEWKGFIHLWRVVGYVLGIDERYCIIH
ncbi:unnamed protein product [Acanthoscelides obtectus]|uniref:ER-bound oxygenase mpaB/mpaB'/Rubber oxygenase catalytic domain-containing protein n=1 Tax=Acanthoscelides obtectus TaxID=200917 RepID=A0A9P0JQC9_ACAOB|nr:unnamed protein product [Acanthoscelides obtectus]CAK1625868.1 hypothetical protein AOBTE_LOCUS3454 [Acanthoscelides obtectus]